MTAWRHRADFGSHLHLRQLPDHLDLFLQDPPERLLGCGLVVVFVLLQGQQLLTNAILRLGLTDDAQKYILVNNRVRMR